MNKIIFTMALCLVFLLSIEIFLRSSLFHYVSYSSSESIDQQIIDRNKSSAWNILFIGDSETRWGINPLEIDSVLHNYDIDAKSFNHAFDGFGVSWWFQLLPKILDDPVLANIKVVAIGIQMISSHRKIKGTGESCGALQRPVLSSPFGKDLNVSGLCSSKLDWDTKLGQKLFHDLRVVRYSSAVRKLIMPSFMSKQNGQRLRFNSSKSGDSLNGFVPHKSIADNIENYASEFSRWKAQYIPERDFKPMNPNIWLELTSTVGFFEQLNNMVNATGRKLVLFALPTNPTLIDIWNRRDDYLRNSGLLQNWAVKNNVIFLDAGIQDVTNPNSYFSDMRHLSGIGAKEYSKKLGNLLAKTKILNSHRIRHESEITKL